MAKRFNPYSYERATVNLEAHGQYTVRDLTKSLRAQLDAFGERIESLGDEAAEEEHFAVICEQIEACLHGGPEASIAVKLQADYDADKLGLNSIMKVQQFILDAYGLEADRGNA